MTYKSLKNHMKNIVKYMAKTYHYKFHVVFDKTSDTFKTSKTNSAISIGVKDVYNRNDIMFTDGVNYMISMFHECQHAIDFNTIRNSVDIIDSMRSFCAEFSNESYYMQIYHHSSLELNAQQLALYNVRNYLHNAFPGHNEEVDNHILYWGKNWFQNADATTYSTFMKASSLDEFLQKFDEYRQTHWENAKPYTYDFSNPCSDHIFDVMLQHNLTDRVHPYDFCFQNTSNAKLQRNAAFLINAETNEELRDLIPVLQDKSALQSVRDDVIDFSSHHSDLQSNLQQTMEKQ